MPGRCAIVARASPLAFFLVACATFAAPGYRGPQSDHFDGKRFHNEEPFVEQSPAALLRWRLDRHRGRWPGGSKSLLLPATDRIGPGRVRVTMINHATVLIQMDSVNILTDPVWSDRLGPVEQRGTRRHRPPGMHFADLPSIDVVLLSHNHYDHMDVPTLRRLAERFHPRIITGLGNTTFLTQELVPGSQDVDWWQTVQLPHGVRVTFVPAQHWSGRGLTDHCRTLWGGFVIEGDGGVVYFAGDTGWGRFFEQIHERWPTISVALLPVAPFRPRWYMHRKHMSPGDAIRAAEVLGAEESIPIHWGTFDLGDDGETEAADSLRSELGAGGTSSRRFVVLANGERHSLGLADRAISMDPDSAGDRKGARW